MTKTDTAIVGASSEHYIAACRSNRVPDDDAQQRTPARTARPGGVGAPCGLNNADGWELQSLRM